MDVTLQLWLDPDEYAALVARIEAGRRTERELEQRILAAWAADDAGERQQAAA